MFKNAKNALIVAIGMGMTSMPSWADQAAIQAEADAFKAAFIAAAGAIGLTYIAAAYGSVIYKWIKGMIFS